MFEWVNTVKHLQILPSKYLTKDIRHAPVYESSNVSFHACCIFSPFYDSLQLNSHFPKNNSVCPSFVFCNCFNVSKHVKFDEITHETITQHLTIPLTDKMR